MISKYANFYMCKKQYLHQKKSLTSQVYCKVAPQDGVLTVVVFGLLYMRHIGNSTVSKFNPEKTWPGVRAVWGL